MSEIDDIFASKGKPKDVVQHVSSSSLSSKKKKKKRSSTAVKLLQAESSKKRRVPDTIVDTSHELPSLAKRRKKEKSKHDIPGNNSEITTFKDSRGNTGRKTTEEGWLVYKEDELGINDQGGDTELCPFDCKCCF